MQFWGFNQPFGKIIMPGGQATNQKKSFKNRDIIFIAEYCNG